MIKYPFIITVMLCVGVLSLSGCDIILKFLQKEIAQEAQILGDISSLHNPQIEQVQNMLQSLGYTVGIADGRMGFRTRTAIKEFQGDHALEEHGYVDQKTWGCLTEEYQAFGVTFEKLAPKQIQIALKEAGFDPGFIDGKMGTRTTEAIKQFQEKQGLAVDGKVGIRTWRKLRPFLP